MVALHHFVRLPVYDTVVKFVHPLNAESTIVSASNVTEVRLVQFANAPPCIVSYPLGIVIDCSEEHPSNALYEIVPLVDGGVSDTDVNDVHPINDWSEM